MMARVTRVFELGVGGWGGGVSSLSLIELNK